MGSTTNSVNRLSWRLTTMLFFERASVTLALASWGFFFFFFVSAAFLGFAAVALAARAAVAFAGRVAVALAGRVAVALAGRVAVALAGLVAVALAGLVAVALAGLGAVALAARVAVAFVWTVRGVGGASTATGAASAAAGAARNATPICCSTFLLVETGCTGRLGVGFSPEVNASSSAQRYNTMVPQGHRLQIGAICRGHLQKMQEPKRDVAQKTSLGGKRSFSSRQDQLRSIPRVEDGTRGTARGQAAGRGLHAK